MQQLLGKSLRSLTVGSFERINGVIAPDPALASMFTHCPHLTFLAFAGDPAAHVAPGAVLNAV